MACNELAPGSDGVHISSRLLLHAAFKALALADRALADTKHAIEFHPRNKPDSLNVGTSPMCQERAQSAPESNSLSCTLPLHSGDFSDISTRKPGASCIVFVADILQRISVLIELELTFSALWQHWRCRTKSVCREYTGSPSPPAT